ncbi:MAG: RsmE family RNA methyltransferase, partial [Alphaproteobacteria bacterium]
MATLKRQLTADQRTANTPETGPNQQTSLPKVRLFHNFEAVTSGSLSMGKDQAHYLAKVLRLQTGAKVGLFNPTAGEWRCEITALSKSSVELNLCEQVRPAQSLPPLQLAFAPLRKERMAFLIEKAVELGVTSLQPLTTEFTNWKFNAEKMLKTVMEAVEQCERVDLPVLHDIQPLSAYLQNLGAGQFVFAGLERDSAASAVSDLENLPETPSLLIGPEGGWS